MTRLRRPAVIAVSAMLAAVLIGLGLELLVAIKPDAPLVPVLEGATVPGAEETDVLTCERRTTTRAEVTRPTEPDGGRVTSSRVVECPTNFDGREVTFVGEVVGDVMRRDDGAWVLLNDDAYALELGPLPASRAFQGGNTGLAVWLAGNLADGLTGTGGARQRGDVVLVRGILRRTDPGDGGGLAIRAGELEVLLEAEALDPPLHVAQAVVAAVASVLAGALALAERRFRDRR